MRSRRSAEGYLYLDHRDSPGVSDAATHRAGMPRGSGRGLFEAAMFSCSHCQATHIINPGPFRTRDLPYCGKCDGNICERCKLALVLTGECKSFRQLTDEVQDRVARGLDIPIIGVPLG